MIVFASFKSQQSKESIINITKHLQYRSRTTILKKRVSVCPKSLKQSQIDSTDSRSINTLN